MVGHGVVDLGDHLGVGVVPGVLGREVGRRRPGIATCRSNRRPARSGGRAVRMRAVCPVASVRRHPAMGLRRTGTREHPAPGRESEPTRRSRPKCRGLAVHRRIVPMRSITRAGRRTIALAAGLLLVAFSAAPALACGGLIGPNGAVNLLRTTTFAGYHDGGRALRHRVRVRRWRRGLRQPDATPRDPVERREGRRLDAPAPASARPNPAARAPTSSLGAAAAAAGEAEVLMEVTIDALDITVLRGGADEVGTWATDHGFRLPPDAPEVLDFYAARSRSSWPPCSTPTRPRSAARTSATARRSTSRSRPTTRGSRCGSWRLGKGQGETRRGRRLPPDRPGPGAAAGPGRVQRHAPRPPRAGDRPAAGRPALRPRHGMGADERVADQGRASMPPRRSSASTSRSTRPAPARRPGRRPGSTCPAPADPTVMAAAPLVRRRWRS